MLCVWVGFGFGFGCGWVWERGREGDGIFRISSSVYLQFPVSENS